jgi:hypothetical protein
MNIICPIHQTNCNIIEKEPNDTYWYAECHLKDEVSHFPHYCFAQHKKTGLYRENYYLENKQISNSVIWVSSDNNKKVKIVIFGNLKKKDFIVDLNIKFIPKSENDIVSMIEKCILLK